MTRKMLKESARVKLQGKWSVGVLATLILSILAGAVGAFSGMGNSFVMIAGQANSDAMLTGGIVMFLLGWAAYLLIIPALNLGIFRIFLKIARGEEAELKELFWGFRYFLKALGLTVMISIFVFLWSLLLLVPGIIAAYRYSQAYFILADNPEIGIMDAIRQSKQMMVGHKMEYFVLELSFLGWMLLCMFCFIGILWLSPYMYVTYGNFYLNLKGEGAEPETAQVYTGPEL